MATVVRALLFIYFFIYFFNLFHLFFSFIYLFIFFRNATNADCYSPVGEHSTKAANASSRRRRRPDVAWGPSLDRDRLLPAWRCGVSKRPGRAGRRRCDGDDEIERRRREQRQLDVCSWSGRRARDARRGYVSGSRSHRGVVGKRWKSEEGGERWRRSNGKSSFLDGDGKRRRKAAGGWETRLLVRCQRCALRWNQKMLLLA